MKRFDNVAKFATANEDCKMLVAMMEDYARHDLNDRWGKTFQVDTKFGKNEKAEKINKLYLSEIQRRSKCSAESEFDGDIDEYASFETVAKMQAVVNKIMLDTVVPVIVNATNLNMLADIHYGGYGDVFEYEMVDDTLYKVSKIGNRQRNTKTQERKKQNKTIEMDWYGLSTVSNLPKIYTGDAMIAKDIMLMGLSMNQKIYSLVVKAFIEATDKISDPKFVVSNYTEKGLLEKLRLGSAHNGSRMIIVGDAVPLKDILPANPATRILLQDPYNTTIGRMTDFNGYDVVEFNVTRDYDEPDGILGLPTNKVYGISTGMNGKIVQLAIGATRTATNNPEDKSDFSMVNTLEKELGVAIATNQQVVRCDMQEA